MACDALTTVCLVFNTITVTAILYFTFMLIKLHRNIRQKSTWFTFIGNYAYCGIILLCATVYMSANIERCTDSHLDEVHEIISVANGFYMLQYFLLLVLLFHRLCSVFATSSAYEISTRVIRIFYFVLLCLTASGIACILLLVGESVNSLATVLGVVSMLGVCILVSIIIGCFIQRLAQIWWNQRDTDKYIDHVWEGIIIKNFILTLLSIMSLIIVIIASLQAVIWVPERYYQTLRQLGYATTLGLDLVTNLMSVFYGIHVFNDHYLFLFGHCHRTLIEALDKKKEHKVTMLKMKEAVSSVSVDSNENNFDEYPDTTTSP